MENKLIKKFCKSKKNGKLYKNKPEGLINYISFYKNSNDDKLKPYSLTFKKNKNKKYNLCKDSSCKKEEYVVKDLSYKKVKKLMKNIDNYKFADIREKINLDGNLSTRIKLKTHTKKQKAKKFSECKEILGKNKSFMNKIKSKKIFQRESKTSQKTKKKFSFDFFKKLIPKRQDKKVIQTKELPPQAPHQTLAPAPAPPKTIIRESNETAKLKKEKEELLRQLKNSQEQQQQMPNTNNSEKKKYLEKIKSLESKLGEVASYGEKKSESEKQLKKKMNQLRSEYEKELKKQNYKIKEGSEKRRRIESEASSKLKKLSSEGSRLRSERNQYKALHRRASRRPSGQSRSSSGQSRSSSGKSRSLSGKSGSSSGKSSNSNDESSNSNNESKSPSGNPYPQKKMLFNILLKSNDEGFGLDIKEAENKLKIIQDASESAKKQGISNNDIIKKIGDINATDFSLEDVKSFITDDKVLLTILSNDASKKLTVTLEKKDPNVSFGYNEDSDRKIVDIKQNSYAELGGLSIGDKILRETEDGAKLTLEIERYPYQTVSVNDISNSNTKINEDLLINAFDIFIIDSKIDNASKLIPYSYSDLLYYVKLPDLKVLLIEQLMNNPGKRSLIITEKDSLKNDLTDITNNNFDIIKIDNGKLNSLLELKKEDVLNKINPSNDEYPKKIDLGNGIIYYDYDNSIRKI